MAPLFRKVVKMKEKFIEGRMYDYLGIQAYCFKPNRLVLEDGRTIRRSSSVYSPDIISLGNKDKNGYLSVKIDSKTVGVHRLVATYFIENPDNLPIVDHINENKEDNHKNNLRWSTVEHNSSRINIRDDRALNEARQTLAAVKEIEKSIQAKIKYNENLVETITQSLAEESHVSDMFKEAMEVRIKKYEDKIDALLAINEVAVANKYKKTLEPLRNQVSKQEAFIALTGKPIKINGRIFPSIRAAADHIYQEQVRLGQTRKQQTIRTELRKIHKGLTTTTLMYGEYRIEVLLN